MRLVTEGRRIAFYCPDRHLKYDGGTPDRIGVGGGVTARLRLAAALAARGHDVTMICNCGTASVHAGVAFTPLECGRRVSADVLLFHTSGDQLDLRSALSMDFSASRRVVLVNGIVAPKGLHEIGMDQLYACSRFIARVARDEWRVEPEKIFVGHHGIERRHFQLDDARRSPFAIAYATHPSKGLDAAIRVVRRLRAVDSRFELHVFGGDALWGGTGAGAPREPGLVDHGLVDQPALARELTRAGFAVYLQTRAEPFGIAVAEALAAGCVTIASPVGAHPEIVEDAVTGFLIDGDPASDATTRSVAELILKLSENPVLVESIRRRAANSPLDWNTVAAVWEQSWAGAVEAR